MLNPKIIEKIESQLNKERFLFWYDEDEEHLACIKELSFTHAVVLLVEEMPALQVKLEIAKADISQKFLFYSTKPEPEPQNDWLLAYRLKGKSFSADSTQILLDELGLNAHVLRPHLKRRSKFLNAKERVEKLKKWTSLDDDADLLDLKILTVIARCDQSDAFSIFNQVLISLVKDDEVVLESDSRIWSEIVQFQMTDAFWALAKEYFGYSSDKPSLKNFLMCILVTDFESSLINRQSLPAQLSHFVLPAEKTKGNAKVFISRWRGDVHLMQAYVLLAQSIADELSLNSLISSIPESDLYDAVTFGEIEERILARLKDNLLNGSCLGDERILDLIKRRKNGFWANLKVAKDIDLTKAYAASYDAIESAWRFLTLKQQFEGGFSFGTAHEGLESYKSTLYQFDQNYRHFHYAADLVEPMGWKLLQELRELIEGSYSGWFIPQFSSVWDKLVVGEQGLLSNWHVSGWDNQQNFYDKQVKRVLNNNIKRVFVLISDAFRYEAAQELSSVLTERNKYQVQLDGMLGVLPSYTTLGMASLLPHTSLAYKQDKQTVLADGISTAGLENRDAVLKQYNGVAIKHEELLALGKEKGRDLVKPYEVIYIYHDRIDAIGDKQSTETKTFEAVNQTIDELAQIVSFVFNSLSASTLFVTADHGFMYQESALEGADKSILTEKPDGTLIAKKRYLLGNSLGNTKQAWFGNTHLTAGTAAGEGSADFWVPKAANRFHFTGGARFVHGSAMPQEIVVPLLTIKQSDSDKAKTKFVEVSLLGSVNKVVTNVQRFELIQTDVVNDYILARTVRVSIQDGQTSITDEKILTLDKSSASLDDRKMHVFLTLKSGDYDRLKEYYFSVRDVDSGVEVLRVPLRIDLAFNNDF